MKGSTRMSIKEKMKSRPSRTVKSEQETAGLKWHKFLVNFALFAAAAWNVLVGIMQLTGLRYIINSHTGKGYGIILQEHIYFHYPAVKFADTLFWVTLFLMAVYQLIIRQMLKKGRKHAPLHLNIMIGIMCTVSALYDFLFEAFVRNERYVLACINYSSSSITIATAAFIGAGLCILNWYYYRERRGILFGKSGKNEE